MNNKNSKFKTMILFKLKLAFRNLLKNKVYSSLIIGGFSIGFAACILIGLYYNTEHNINTHFPNYKNIYRVYDAKRNKCNLDYELYSVFKENYTEIANACPLEYYANHEFTIKDAETGNHTRVKHFISTTNDFFDIFSTDVLTSLSDKPLNGKESAVITESVAKRLFGDENPLGKTLDEEFFTATVSAVIKDLPENSTFQAELILNCENKEFQLSMECIDGICIYPTNHFIELNSEKDGKLLVDKLNSTIRNYNTNVNSLALQKLDDIYLTSLTMYDAHSKGNSKMLSIFLSIAFLILLLSSINYLNYTISMQYAKLKEIGINKTNGAAWFQLLSNSFIEVTLGIFLSLIISIIISALALPYTKIFFGKEIMLSHIDFRQLLPVFIEVLLAIILINSIAPVYILSRFKITEFLKGGMKRNGKQIGKQAMLTFQLTVSIALIVVVMLFFKQLKFVKHYDLGFNEDHLIRIELPYLHDNPSLIKDEISKLPFVKGSTLSDGYPGWIKLKMGSGDDEKKFMVNCIHISDDFINTMGIELLEGREFLSGDKNKACYLNEEAVKQFDWNNIENKRYNNGEGYEVVGMVKNFNVRSLHSGIAPAALIYDPGHDFNSLSVRLETGNIGDQIAQIKESWNKLVPETPMYFTFYDEQFQAMYEKEEKLAHSVTFFSIIAIALTCMGILGQIFLISLERTKEIGVRKVNGAKISEILALLNKDFIKWVAFAFLIAVPVSWYAINKWLENFAYKTELSWWVFALAGVIALGISLLTVSWQSWRAASRNPIEALRYE